MEEVETRSPGAPLTGDKNILRVGVDVGSTTVKAVVMEASGETLWKKYQRHNTRLAQVVREFLEAIEETFPGRALEVFATGSGGRAVAPHLNATFVPEVNAVTYAVEKLCPDARSAVELGGQDAKVIIWKTDDQQTEDPAPKTTLTFMNDKCAGGTGATIDKILAKIGVSQEEAGRISAQGKTVHHVAAKCGVFAETDVVGLLKSGVSREEIVTSLGSAIVKQNLEVLVHGNILRDRVVLLGGPHTYLGFLAEFWRLYIQQTWDMLGWTPREMPLSELVHVPPDSLYFAAYGALFIGMESAKLSADPAGRRQDRIFPGIQRLSHYIAEGRVTQMLTSGAVSDGLVGSDEEAQQFARSHAVPPFHPPDLSPGTDLRCHLGIDGGSTSSKLVLMDPKDQLVYRDYRLSRGNPIEDLRHMFGELHRWRQERGLRLTIETAAITGYAAPILKEAFRLDLEVVETVAHMRSAVSLYGDVDVICDVGGQDIKVLFMKNRRVVDFRLNTQCSAGNGYLLQTMAEQFGVPLERYADSAFNARRAPAFNIGCAVFLEQDRVNFQQLGWTNEEIMAGLAMVLPKNIWNHVVQEPHIARFGRRFVLQGGTQKNLAAVKAQVDHIQAKVPGAEVHVHQHADVCGAMGAAIEARQMSRGEPSRFIGISRAAAVTFQATSNEQTRCGFCDHRCPRTFVDIRATPEREVRFISGNGCERGQANNREQMRHDRSARKLLLDKNPNLVQQAATQVFEAFTFDPLPHAGAPRLTPAPPAKTGGSWWASLLPGAGARPDHRGFERSAPASARRRGEMIMGIPRLLNMYYYAPFFSTYFRALGVGRVVYSDYTSQRLWQEGNIWGAIDPCFPAKAAPAHIYNLLEKKRPTHICFPIITHLESTVENTLGNNACVIQMGTPEVAEAVFTRDRDHFAERGVSYWKPFVRMDKPEEAAGELFEYFEDRLGISEDENAWAVDQAYAANARYLARLQADGRQVINQLVTEDRMGVLVIGHPYHHDPGLNHGILEELQVRGYPVLCIESLPTDRAFLEPLFGKEETLRIDDVWMRNFNRNTNLKIWAAKVASRHPNLAIIDLSSFKCGHDAPTYSYIESILDRSETPHFLFHDIDQNKPRASLEIRIKTIDYFLRLEEKKLRAMDRASAG